jgi:hypothetical protein
VLVAARKGYVPDFSPIGVRGARANALVVTTPRASAPGEPVSITVTDRANGEPVKDAGVWALTRESADALKTEVSGIRTADDAGVDVESLLNGRGFFLGTTHGNGELKYTFEKEGVYVLVAFKRGYLPGYTGIAIKNAPKALAIEAPRTAPIGEPATIAVSERPGGDKVKDVGVWALTPAQAEQLRTRLAAGRLAESATIDLESVAGGFGIFLGRTNGNGELRYTFDKAGRYVLVAVKQGYIPGYTNIGVVAPKPAVTANATLRRPTFSPDAPERPKPDVGSTQNSTRTNTARKAPNT